MSFRKSCHMPFDLLPSLERVQPIRIRRQCVMRVRGFHNVGKPAQTDPKLLRYASTITKQKKCWELFKSLTGFKLCAHATTCNKVYKRTQHVSSIQSDVSQESCVRLHGALLGKREGKHGITGLTRQKDSVKCSTYKRRFWPSFRSL